MRRLILPLLFLLAAAPAWASVAFDAVASANGALATLSWTHTPVGTPTGVIVDVISDTGVTHNGVTYGGTAMTQVGVTVANNVLVSQWKLGSPASGAQTVTVTFSAAIDAIGASFTVTGSNATTAGMTGSQFTNTGNSTSLSVTVTSASGELVIDAAAIANATGTLTVAGTGETQRFNVLGGIDTAAGGTTAGAASVVMAWTASAADFWAMSGLSVKAAGGVVAPKRLPLLGVGGGE